MYSVPQVFLINMCRNYKFIIGIENKSVADFISYALRLKRLYCVFGAFAFINVMSTYMYEGNVILGLQIVGIVLYLLLIMLLTWLDSCKSTDTAVRKLVQWILALLVLNTANNFFSFLYLISTEYSWTLFFSLFSLFLQVTTWYIFYHFLVQIDKEASGCTLNEGLSPEPSAPTDVDAIPRAYPVAQTVDYPLADKV